MNIEILLIALLFIFSLGALFVDPKRSVYILLVMSVLLHKELFSMYSWNILPVRVFMGALLVFIVVDLVRSLITRTAVFSKADVLNPVTVSFAFFWLIAGLSIFFSKNLTASISVYAFLTTVVVLVLYLARVLEGKKERALTFIKIYAVLAFLLSLIGYIQIFVFAKYNFIFGAFWNVPGHMPRVGSLFWDVNHFAGLLVLLLPVVGALFVTSGWKSKCLYLVVGISLFTTLILTNARSGWVAGGIAFLVFSLICVFRRFRYKGLAGVFAVILVASGILLSQYLIKDSVIRREIRQYFHYRLDSFDSHFLLLTGSWQIFEKYPVLGGGYGSFFEQFSKTKISATFFARDPAALNTRVPAHSIWGELLAETGILGFSAMLVFYFGVVFTLSYASLRLKNPREWIMTAAMSASIAGILAAGVFYSYNSEFFWLILFLYFFYALFALRSEFKESPSKLWGDIFSYFMSSPKFPGLVLVVLSLVLIFINLGTNHLIPWDEAIYAKVSQNILQRNNWLTLSWNQAAPWFEKPPLYFWLSALLLQIIPSSELAVRLPSAVFGFLSVIVVYLFAKKLFGKTAGFIAGLCLLTTFHFLYYSRTGMLDVTCSFFILAALYFYYQADWRHALPAGIFCGLAVMTKGVVGLLPLVIITVYETGRIFTSKLSTRSIGAGLLKITTVVVFAMLIALPWHIKMYQLHGQAFVDNYFGYHVLERATSDTENKGAPWYWYGIVLKVSMRLWFVALIPSTIFAVYSLIKNSTDRKKLSFVVLWTVIVLAVFSWSKSKLVWYIIPIYPALAVVVGYFYSAALSYVDSKLSRLKCISSFALKSAIIYITICISLLYLLANRDLVYTSDLTGSQAQMLQLKDATFGTVSKVYADRIDLPLMLFYTSSPFEITDFSPLRKIINSAGNGGNQLIFITKESRFKKLQGEFPAVRLVGSSNEWYLGELVGK